MTISTTYARTTRSCPSAAPTLADGVLRLPAPVTAKQFPIALGVLCFSMLLLAGCHHSGAAITVQVQPSSSISIDEGQSVNFTATVANDTLNKGVSWSLNQSTGSGGCSGSGCGTLTNVTNASATYVAPTGLSAGESVTLTVASVAQSSATTTATISVVLPVTFTTTTLPNGSNGVPYNQTIAVTGGVAPLAFSLQSGSTLPAGLSLTTGGTIVGKPSGPGSQMNPMPFTVVVTDNGTKPSSVSQALSIFVTPAPPLSIVTTSLPVATSNTNYTAPAIGASGGVLPLRWSLLSGALPPGLALSPVSGQISGVVPTGTSGSFSFMVQAQDEALPTNQSAQQTLSISVQAPQTLAIATTTLPSGTTATGYNQPLQASGGIPPYTWTITSGLLPSGLTLAQNGVLSGVPVLATTTNPDVFSVQVRDSEVQPQVTAPQQLSITISAGSNNGNSLISGAYSFLFNGFDTGGLVMIAGSITTDGNGTITGGVEDSNRVSGVVTSIPLTGSYSLGTDGRGTMTLVATNPTSKVTLTTDYRLVVDSSGTIHFIQNNDITTPGVGTDTLGTHGEGILKPVSGTPAASNFVGNYSFLFSGQDMSAKPAALGGVFHSDGASSLIPAAGGVGGDLNDAGAFSSQNITGTFSVGANNRGAASLLFDIPGKSQTTLQFAFYFVSATDIFFIELDMSSTAQSPIFYRLSGEMVAQQPSVAFSNTSLTGTSVSTGSGLDGSNASVLAGLLSSVKGDGNATLAYDENNGGAITSPAPSFTGTYAVATNGRVAFTGLGSRAAVAYLTGPGQGFLLGSDASVTTGLLEQQTGTTMFTVSSVQGGYTLSTSFPVESKVVNTIGQVSSDGNGTVSGNQSVDEILPPTTSAPEGTAVLGGSLGAHINFIGSNGRGTMVAVATGPFQFPAALILYVVSPAHFRAISADSNPGNAHPEVFFFDH